MFLPQLEMLAAERPSIKGFLQKLDGVLAETPNTSLVASEISNRFGTLTQTTEAILSYLVEKGLLSKIEGRLCKHCLQFNKLNDSALPSHCSSCLEQDMEALAIYIYKLSEVGHTQLTIALNGLESSQWPPSVQSYKGKIDAVVISMKPEEFNAILDQFPHQTTVVGRRDYNILRIRNLKAQSLLIATFRTIDQGEGESQNAVRDAIEDLDPNLILLTGIAGAVPGDATLGDVIFGSRVHDLTVGAIDDKGLETFDLSGGPMEREVQIELANLQATLPSAYHGLDKPLYPDIGIDSLQYTTTDDEARDKILSTLRRRVGYIESSPSHPYFMDGSIASSDKLIKNSSLVTHWKKFLRKILAVEMELAGAYRAARTRHKEYRLLSIRCVSDVVGLKRSNDWEAFACKNAAVATKAFIRILDQR